MSGSDLEEAQDRQAKTDYEPTKIEVDMRLPAREVEAILRRFIHFPERLDGQLEAASYSIAGAMGEHYLGVHMLCMGDMKGRA